MTLDDMLEQAVTDLDEGRLATAWSLLQQARELAPDDDEVLVLYCEVLAARGEQQRAVELLRRRASEPSAAAEVLFA